MGRYLISGNNVWCKNVPLESGEKAENRYSSDLLTRKVSLSLSLIVFLVARCQLVCFKAICCQLLNPDQVMCLWIFRGKNKDFIQCTSGQEICVLKWCIKKPRKNGKIDGLNYR